MISVLKRLLLASSACFVGLVGLQSISFAEDEPNSVAAWSWRPSFTEIYGDWATTCDYRERDGRRQDRCYVRFVDVYSPRPKFGAVFLFVTPEASGSKVSFGLETGIAFEEEGFRIENDGKVAWRFDPSACVPTGACDFLGSDSERLIAVMREGGQLKLAFRDAHGAQQGRSWDLTAFRAAYETFERQVDERNLRR